MIKGRGGSQIGNLIPNHKSIESKHQVNSDWSVLYTVENIFSRAIKYCPYTFKKDLIGEKYECPKFWDNKSLNFGTPTWES
jgi:hypothetical protein